MAFDRVSFRYPRAQANALDDVSFRLVAGTSLGIVGESGSGKSTILQILLGLRAATAGTMLFDGTPLDPRSRRQMRAVRRRVQPVFQDSYSSLDPRQRVGRIVAEPVISLGLERGRAPVEERARAALADVGLEDDVLDRYRPNTPAVSANASRSPARWSPDRRCWWRTSP